MTSSSSDVKSNGSDAAIDPELLTRIIDTELQIMKTCDLISLSNWGFDSSIQEKLRQRKHRLVNQQLSKKEKSRLSKSQKQNLARSIGVVCNTVSEVLDWMSTSVVKDIQPKAAPNVMMKKNVDANNEKIKEKPTKKPEPTTKQNLGTKVSNSSDEEDSNDEGMEVDERKVKDNTQNVEKANTNKEKNLSEDESTEEADSEVAEDSDNEEDDDENSDDEKEETENDTTDEEIEEDVENPKKRKAVEKISAPAAKKTKIDKELEKVKNIDLSTLDPLESRRIAMLKLQKKIADMKVNRTSKDKAKRSANVVKLEDDRKMKRKLSKLKLKQKRAEEKQKKGDKQEKSDNIKSDAIKEDNKLNNEGGKVVYSKFDFIVKDAKKKKLSKAEKKDKFTGKNYKALLTKVEKRKEALKDLKEKEPEKAQILEDSIKWNRALKKAAGVKVKDNEELLRKGLHKKEKMKEKKKEKWDNRIKRVDAEKDKKQAKKKNNLQKRIDDKKKKNMALLRKKGRIL